VGRTAPHDGHVLVNEVTTECLEEDEPAWSESTLAYLLDGASNELAR
jgi:hypothetical protein